MQEKPNLNSNKFDALREGDGDHVDEYVAGVVTVEPIDANVDTSKEGGLNVNVVEYTPKKKTKSLVTIKKGVDKPFSKAAEKLDPKSANVLEMEEDGEKGHISRKSVEQEPAADSMTYSQQVREICEKAADNIKGNNLNDDPKAIEIVPNDEDNTRGNVTDDTHAIREEVSDNQVV
ncbi:hypothetical protein K7X08_011860 [Anisodus acutangulus]|uniref:Uncharacterized protein n=1 Tax=Anisodus acutangulus TaxID=402998 RepID=A0A9Q1QY27_9SOLA|nr:hypothetical protein K7X08_011860 [Anisodus acutangulus]